MTLYPLYRKFGRPQVGPDGCGKFAPTGIQSPDRPARNESLYRRYPSPHTLKLKEE